MISLQSKKTITFRRQVAGQGEQTFHVRPTATGETVAAPDWVRKDPYFQLHLNAGSLVEVVVKSAPPQEDAVVNKGKSGGKNGLS